MSKKCYSTNEEDFTYDDLNSAIRDALDDPAINIGDVVVVYEGDASLYKAGDFTGGTLDAIANTAYDEGGEYSDHYLDKVTKAQEADLDKRIADVVNQWADEYGLQPDFYKVENVKEIRVKLLSETGTYELLAV